MRFLIEAKRWSEELKDAEIAPYVLNIVKDVNNCDSEGISEERAERYLMYGALLQNYSRKNMKDQ